MALALARHRGQDADGAHRFDVQVGAQQYWTWAVGSGPRTEEGVTVLDRTQQRAPLLGPLAPSERGRVVLRVPADAFTEDAHHLQVLSYRDEELRGPAASDLVEVPWAHPSRRPARENGEDPGWRPPSRPASLSQAQFLDGLAGLVGAALPIVRAALPVLEAVVPGRPAVPAAGPTPAATPAGTTPAGTTPAGTTPAGTTPAAGTPGPSTAGPDLARLLAELLRQVQALRAGPPARTASTLGALPPPQYATASVAPLLAALPALMPLLQQVLTPETVQAVVGAADPSKLLTTVFKGVTDVARIGQEATDRLHEHLRALNPGLGDDVLIPLLAATNSLARSPGRGRPSSSVRLAVRDLVGIELHGYPQVCVQAGSTLRLPLSLQTSRRLPASRLTVVLRDAGTLRTIARRTQPLPPLDAGPVPDLVELPGALTRRLRPGQEALVEISLRWPGRTTSYASTVSQLVRVVGALTFDALLPGGRPVRLDDVERDRAWWHRVHAVALGEGTTRLEAEVRYDYRLDPELASGTRRRPTTAALTDDGRRRTGTLVSGLDVSAAELGALRQRLGGTSFTPEQLAAFAVPEFAAAFGRSARGRFVVRGRRGVHAALWAWPELALQTAVLRAPESTSPLTGQVLAFRTEPVLVPVPVLAHLLTTRT